jgi:aminoglycoside 6'-N-acetyltransferase I
MIYQAKLLDLENVAKLAYELWPEANYEELINLFSEIIEHPEFAIFIAREYSLIGFGYFSLRNDYVEGTTSSPVGYIEGVYVKEEERHKGIASKLIDKGVKWAKSKGCTEMASDCIISNKESEAFHKALGFIEANRIICFTKEIN